jgi:hypothetical protein
MIPFKKPVSTLMIHNRIRLLSIATVLIALFVVDATAQDLHPSRRPSPVGIAKTHIGDAYVKVTYGRPYVRGRKIFGTSTADETFLVPYGQVWRTGANEATEITLTQPLLVGGQRLEAGTYSIFTVPRPNNWTIHVSPHLGLDGTGIFNSETQQFRQVFDATDDVLTLQVPPGTIDEPVNQFTISFIPADGGADMTLRWERTEVRIPVRPVN